VFDRLNVGIGLLPAFEFPGDKAIQIVTIGPVGAESLFVEQPLDPTTSTNLVGMILQTNRPAHFAVPAAAKNHQSSSSHSRGHQAQRRCPTRPLFLFTHRPQPVTRSKT
jgi:hypothetical protein